MANATKKKSKAKKRSTKTARPDTPAPVVEMVPGISDTADSPQAHRSRSSPDDDRSSRRHWVPAEFVTIIDAKHSHLKAELIRPMLLRDHGTIRSPQAINAQFSAWNTGRLSETMMVAIEALLYTDEEEPEEEPSKALDMSEPANRIQLSELVAAIQSFEQRLQPALDEAESLKAALAEIRRRADNLAAALELVAE